MANDSFNVASSEWCGNLNKSITMAAKETYYNRLYFKTKSQILSTDTLLAVQRETDTLDKAERCPKQKTCGYTLKRQCLIRERIKITTHINDNWTIKNKPTFIKRN